MQERYIKWKLFILASDLMFETFFLGEVLEA